MRALRIAAVAGLVAVLGAWVVYSLLLLPVFGVGAFVVAPLVVVSELASRVEAALWPSAQFRASGLCNCDFSLGPEQGTAAEIAIEKGSTYARSGEQWQDGRAVVIGSPDGAYVALVSYSGPTRPGGLYGLSLRKRWWDVYVDVFEAKGGRKLATLSWLRQVAAEPPRVRVSWNGDRTLVWVFEGKEAGWGRCQTPPSAVQLGPFPHATFSIGSAGEVAVRVAPHDGDGNGQMEALVVDATFAAPRAGSYSLWARVGRNKKAESFPGFTEPVYQADADVTQKLAAGAARLRISFDPKQLAELPGSEPLVLHALRIDGEGMLITSTDRYLLPVLPPPETVPFYYTNSATLALEPGVVAGSYQFVTPGGMCTWGGEVSHGAQRIPFRQSERLIDRVSSIPFRVPVPGWVASAERPVRLRLLTMECGGRTAALPSGNSAFYDAEISNPF